MPRKRLFVLLLSSSALIAGHCSQSTHTTNAPQSAATAATSAATARKAAIATIRKIAQAECSLDCSQPVDQVLQSIAAIYETFDIEAAQARCHYCLAGEQATTEAGHIEAHAITQAFASGFQTLATAMAQAEGALRAEKAAQTFEKQGHLPQALAAYEKATQAYQGTEAIVKEIVAKIQGIHAACQALAASPQ